MVKQFSDMPPFAAQRKRVRQDHITYSASIQHVSCVNDHITRNKVFNAKVYIGLLLEEIKVSLYTSIDFFNQPCPQNTFST